MFSTKISFFIKWTRIHFMAYSYECLSFPTECWLEILMALNWWREKKKMTTTINNRINTWIPNRWWSAVVKFWTKKIGQSIKCFMIYHLHATAFQVQLCFYISKCFLCYWIDAINTPSRWLHPVVIWHGIECVLVEVTAFRDHTRTTYNSFIDNEKQQKTPKTHRIHLGKNVITHRQQHMALFVDCQRDHSCENCTPQHWWRCNFHLDEFFISWALENLSIACVWMSMIAHSAKPNKSASLLIYMVSRSFNTFLELWYYLIKKKKKIQQ